MERRGISLGIVIAGLGLALSCCLLPYLISSAYSVASVVLQVPDASKWLWGDWLSTVLDPTTGLYRLVVESPVCCVGVLGLLTTVVGVVWLVSGRDRAGAPAGDLDYGPGRTGQPGYVEGFGLIEDGETLDPFAPQDDQAPAAVAHDDRHYLPYT